MNVLSVSAEIAPFSRTGGMGDVCGALPRALAARGHRVTTASPRYGLEMDSLAWDTGLTWSFHLFGAYREVRYFLHRDDRGVDHVLVHSPLLHRGGIYGDGAGPYGDNLLRFALLSRAALELPRRLPLGGRVGGPVMGEDFVLHAHDWSAALSLVYLRAHYQPLGLYPGVRAVLSLHNAAHHGRFAPGDFEGLDLSPRHRPSLEHEGDLSCLKAGIVTADDIVAVSPSFARELRTPAGGFGMDRYLRDREGLHGVLNGVDTREWDPATDPWLPAPFQVGQLAGKAACKAALQRELGLPVRADRPLIGMVARLDYQKGVDLVIDAGPWLIEQGAQLAVLGTGDPRLAEALRALESRAPESVRVRIAFDTGLSHRIFGGADLCLVPSRFEPCGLTQLYGMRYGAVPVVRSTGGLADTVIPWNPGEGSGTGWRFEEASAAGLAEALGWALLTWRDYPEAFARVRENGMRADWSWDRSAARYEQIYGGGHG